MAHFEPFSTAQVSVTTVATNLAVENRGRRVIMVTNTGTTAVYIGADNTVTTLTGQLLPGSVGAAVSIPTTGQVWAIVGAGTATVCVTEVQE